ncbi:porin [Flavihumibacter stibioxidans]|uniref:Beta-barrel porin-2, OmpL-like. bbp2 n=1 Tax=Flavihumibacter stibioxidans TaxID=1834163 RepID=A0ABR7MCH2_9BACT|nr:porin [Flavihumibacter stibioxidans]MBC6492667.1 hypothetical protein [Flavihumibacter stibioxidans]
MKALIISILAIGMTTSVLAQDTDSMNNKLKWSVFADIYYSYDFNQPSNHEKVAFLYNHKRHNEINVNLAMVQATYQDDRYRGNIAMQAGTYTEYNYTTEQGLLKHIFQANAGIKLANKRELWLDVGIFPSHIGYESAITKDNWTLTRSLMAENSPYYEAGIKLGYTSKNEKWLISGMLLNGWQRIRRVDGNSTPAFGWQVRYSPNSATTINWSSFVGNDFPDSVRRWRYFNNLYCILQPNEKFGITLAFDIGMEQAGKASSRIHKWFTPNIVVRYAPNRNWEIALRGEYYRDENGVIIGTGTPDGFRSKGGSINIDRKINNYFLWRAEFRSLNNRDAIFNRNGSLVNNNSHFTTSLTMSF